MGLFDLFKRKDLKFEKKCLIEGPSYLNGNFRDVPKDLINVLRLKENEYTWLRQIYTAKGESSFRIKYYGNLSKYPITEKNNLPQSIVLEGIDSGEKVPLFDGAKHGYDAVFWKKFPIAVSTRKETEKYTYKEVDAFEIVLLVRYSLELKEEFDNDYSEIGFVENNRGEKLGREAFSNGFDSIEAYAITKEGQAILILAEETA